MPGTPADWHIGQSGKGGIQSGPMPGTPADWFGWEALARAGSLAAPDAWQIRGGR